MTKEEQSKQAELNLANTIKSYSYKELEQERGFDNCSEIEQESQNTNKQHKQPFTKVRNFPI
jgi:hypothetical protein